MLGVELKKAGGGVRGEGRGQKSRWRLDQVQVAQAQYESFINNTCGLILRNPQKGRGDKGFVLELC